jgi:hypothetical protein
VLEGRCTDNSYIEAVSKLGTDDAPNRKSSVEKKVQILCNKVFIQEFTNGRTVTSFLHKDTMLGFGGSHDKQNAEQVNVDDLYPGKTAWNGINNEEDANGAINHGVEGRCLSNIRTHLMSCEASFVNGNNRYRFYATINITKKKGGS